MEALEKHKQWERREVDKHQNRKVVRALQSLASYLSAFLTSTLFRSVLINPFHTLHPLLTTRPNMQNFCTFIQARTPLIIILMRVIYIAPKNVIQTHRRIKSHCTSASRMTSILRHVAEAFLPARPGSILNSYRVISIATNTSMVLNCALVTYIRMTADVGLPDAV